MFISHHKKSVQSINAPYKALLQWLGALIYFNRGLPLNPIQDQPLFDYCCHTIMNILSSLALIQVPAFFQGIMVYFTSKTTTYATCVLLFRIRKKCATTVQWEGGVGDKKAIIQYGGGGIKIIDLNLYHSPTISGLISSVRRALASKVRGPGFKSRPGTVGGHYNNVGCSARLKTSFELNSVTEGKQWTFPFLYHLFHK